VLFIELHDGGFPILVNIDRIIFIQDVHDGQVKVWMTGGYTIEPDESYEDIMEMILGVLEDPEEWD